MVVVSDVAEVVVCSAACVVSGAVVVAAGAAVPQEDNTVKDITAASISDVFFLFMVLVLLFVLL